MPPSTDPATITTGTQPGLLNLRDLGGTPTRDGDVIAPGRLLRAAEPVGLSRTELDQLRTLGVRSRLDLRGDQSARACAELDAAGLEVHRHPFRDLLAAEDLPPLETAEQLGRHYLTTVRGSVGSLLGALQAIAGEATLGVLVHCAWGKDRAGIVVASTLELLGVDRDLVVADYARTGPAVGALLDRVLARLPAEVAARADRDRLALQAPAATMATFLAEVDTQHGGIAGLLAEAGADAADLRDQLRGRLLR
ncbi:MAG: tyrosine-protein phosphatase [Nitriliruptor sp.]